MDALNPSSPIAEHITQISVVLSKGINNLCVKLVKCELHQNAVWFLGYIIIHEKKVKIDNSKVEAVTIWSLN